MLIYTDFTDFTQIYSNFTTLQKFYTGFTFRDGLILHFNVTIYYNLKNKVYGV